MNTATEKSKVKSMTTKELVTFYNASAGKNISKFRDRGTAERLVLAEMLRQAPPLPPKPVYPGRPVKNTHVALNGEGSTCPHPKSLRGQILKFIRDKVTSENQTVALADLQASFGGRARGAVQKLIESKHLKRVNTQA